MNKEYRNQLINRFTPITLLITLIFVIAGVSESFGQNPHFTSIDYPGAAQTSANAVNANGDIVGLYILPGAAKQRGFLLHDGAFTSIEKSGAIHTMPYGINDAGDISGIYTVTGGLRYGFLLPAGSSTFQTIQYDASNSTWAYGINNNGVVIGAFLDPVPGGHTKSYSWDSGVFSVFEAPFPGTTSTFAHMANDRGEIVGAYYTGAPSHGFWLLTDGTYVSNDFPDATSTINWGISASSLVVGQYTDMSDVSHGFLMKNGEYSSFDYPESTYTAALGITEIAPLSGKGMRKLLIVGGYKDAIGLGHGFLFTRQIGVGKGEF